MLARQNRRLFSLFTKVPKDIAPASQNKSWFYRLFSKNQQSPTYILLGELFTYLQGTDIFQREFPFMANSEQLLENNMIMHVHLLKQRLAKESELPRSELQIFNYNLQSVYFPQFAEHVHPAIPTRNFKAHFAESYMNKLVLYSELVNEFEFMTNATREVKTAVEYALVLRKVAYENKMADNSVELLKYCKYYTAHKKYLGRLDWQDMLQYKVKWGLDSLRLINEAGSQGQH